MFDPRDWFWVVNGDESRAWSSAAGGYVAEYPRGRVTRIASEAELQEVLAQYAPQGAAMADRIERLERALAALAIEATRNT